MESKQRKKGSLIFDIVLITTLVGLLLSLIYSMSYIESLEEQLESRGFMIDNLLKKDSLLNNVFELNYDSTETSYSYSYRIKNGQIVKYNELADSLDNARRDRKEYLRIINLIQEQYNIDYTITRDSNYTNYSVSSSFLDSMNIEFVEMESALKIMYERYGFIYNVENDGNKLYISIPRSVYQKFDDAFKLHEAYTHSKSLNKPVTVLLEKKKVRLEIEK